MAVLSTKKILQEKNTSDPDSITSLTLTHKAISDVSCLSEFKNLERLDLGFNNLTSLEGLKSCMNLKWLSVLENKLQSLKGIEGLTKLTVLNAGKNKLKSIDDIRHLASLRALILNDNEIHSVCKLDQMKELNTLVLSRNPISSLGESLVKLKSITKLSLSNCQLRTLDLSLKFCIELKELRLAHNEIMIIPSEFGHLVKLQNLDLGNNLITNWSNLKVLSSLGHLRNLNLQGNPVAEKDDLLKKVKKLLPNLHIFNARPIDKIIGKEEHEKAFDFSVEADNKFTLGSETKIDQSMTKKKNKTRPLDGSMDNYGSTNKRKILPDEKDFDSAENTSVSEKKMKKNSKLQGNESVATSNERALNPNPDVTKKSKDKKQRKNQLAEEPDVNVTDDKKSRKKTKGDKLKIIDSAETPFADLFANLGPEVPLVTAEKKLGHYSDHAVSGLVTVPIKKKKRNHAVDPAALESSLTNEIGLGGPSAWDDM